MQTIAAGQIEQGRGLSLRPWAGGGRGWQVRELSLDGRDRILRGTEKRRALLALGVLYRRGACEPWPRQSEIVQKNNTQRA